MEVEDHPGHDVVHPREDVGPGFGRHLAVCQEDGAAGPFPVQVLRVLAEGWQAGEECQHPALPSSGELWRWLPSSSRALRAGVCPEGRWASMARRKQVDWDWLFGGWLGPF